MRIARLLNLVMLLLRHDHLPASTLAKRFEVTTRTIYRDVEALNLAGIPIYATRGRYGGIGLLPNYKVDKKLLTETDIGNLLTALNGVDNLIETPEIRATLQKIQAMYQPIVSNLTIQHDAWPGTAALKVLAGQFDQAIRQNLFVQFHYNDHDGHTSQRKIEPYRLTYRRTHWYVQGYSLERQAWRTFRLSRMTDVTVTTTHFTPRPLPDFPTMNPQTKHMIFVPVTLTADHTLRDLVVERFGLQAIRHETPSGFQAQLNLPQTESGYRFLLSLGLQATVQAPTAFMTGFQDYLTAVQQNYSKPAS